MRRWIICVILLIAIAQTSEAQFSRYVIKFKNKGSNPFSLSNPQQFLSQRTIDRRTRYSIPYDSTDLPVTPRYIDSVRLSGAVTILNISKWLNSVTIQTGDQNALNKINSLPFVQSTAPIAKKVAPGTPLEEGAQAGTFKKGTQSLSPEVKEVNGIYNTTADFYNYG
ncbi:MAG TPA: hypothetical protein VM368_01825, partial [Flavisolibacter sp.]|nr:hypothetical protein [Flavisolibacter sp.]